MKRCSKCTKEKEDSEYNKDRQQKSGLCSLCRKCQKVVGRGYYLANQEKIRAYRLTRKEWQREYAKSYTKSYQEEACRALIHFYGPFECRNCRERDPYALTFAHPNGTGAAHRREIGSSKVEALARNLRKNGWPKEALFIQCGSCQLREERHGWGL